MKKKLAFALCAALMLCSMSVAALAAEPMTEADTVSTMISAADTLPSVSAYPAEVRASEENGVYRLEKVYYLTAKDDPATIPTADFEREGRTYTLLDLLKNDQTETDTREHIEVVTLESKTKDMAEILKMLEPKLEVKTEDGYEGVLSLDHTTIQVEAVGYGTSSRTVTAERTYPNLSDADVSLVPKSVNENGRTLTLANVNWQEAAVDPTDGYDIPIRYTAVVSYTGTATSKYATGYTVTADYKGDVTRTSCDTVIYTAVFSSVGNEAATDSSSFNWLWLLIPVGAAALGGCGYVRTPHLGRYHLCHDGQACEYRPEQKRRLHPACLWKPNQLYAECRGTADTKPCERFSRGNNQRHRRCDRPAALRFRQHRWWKYRLLHAGEVHRGHKRPLLQRRLPRYAENPHPRSVCQGVSGNGRGRAPQGCGPFCQHLHLGGQCGDCGP